MRKKTSGENKKTNDCPASFFDPGNKASSFMMDSLDRELIDQLFQDADQSSNVLAKKLNADPSTIRRRIQRLINEGGDLAGKGDDGSDKGKGGFGDC
jgi:hypothetical protein